MNKRAGIYFYNVVIFFLIITGFGQMPIFKRYYIADIPGLGWLAQFYKTFFIHYVAAFGLILFASYLFTKFYLEKRDIRLTKPGLLRVIGLSGLFISGVLLIIKNFEITPYAPAFIVFLYLSHIGFVMLYCGTALYSRIFKRQYLVT